MSNFWNDWNWNWCLTCRQIRECLKLDPDHKECFAHYKKVKALSKQLAAAKEFKNGGQYQECIDKVRQILKTESEIRPFILRARSLQCRCFSKVNVTLFSVKYDSLCYGTLLLRAPLKFYKSGLTMGMALGHRFIYIYREVSTHTHARAHTHTHTHTHTHMSLEGGG